MDCNNVERAVTAGLRADSMAPDERSDEQSMEELESLLRTAGGVCVGSALQHRPSPDPRTFIGDGKVKELRALIDAEECTLAVFDNELSPSQTRALGEELGVRVIDRSTLILDIFASRAQSREGRLQVELAQYKYLLPRLTGMWSHLVRQTGSSAPIGTRGPGETQLETDRRHIRRRIAKLEDELRDVRRVRSSQRRLREKNALPVVALVGYTNSGKSTLLNALTNAGIQANDRLFDTLDTTTRRMRVNDRVEALLSDTVGFIHKLPHHLIDAFGATLEELKFADLLVHVIDSSNPEWDRQARVVNALIARLGAESKPRIEAFNKCDLTGRDATVPHGTDAVEISAKTGEGTDKLLARIGELLSSEDVRALLRLPYSKGGLVDTLTREGGVTRTEYRDGYIEMEAVLRPDVYGRVSQYAQSPDGAQEG
ncbi:MAG: GTPase HflX [Oscillospiraceae bacterium]|nr:GTPase HflX [Oscillospiraceae bacterium]